MKVEYLFVPDVLSCRPDDSLVDVAQLLSTAGVGALAVVDERGDLVGVISERDLVRAQADKVDPLTATVREHAARNVCVASVDEDSSTVGRRMLDAGVRHLPVMDGPRLIGMVSMRDLLAVHTWA